MTLAEELNSRNVNPNVTKGVVELESVPENIDELCNSEGEVTDEKFSKYLDWLWTLKAYLDTHPYGREGGYVPHVTEESENRTAWYNENENCWQD